MLVQASRVSHSSMGVASILSKLLYTHPQILTHIMGRFSHNCMGFAMGVHPCLPASIMATLRRELNFRELSQLCKHTVLVLVVEAKKRPAA